MRHLELHIIQSVPVACLNRDDLNSPKTAVFGGAQRARVSSQSWKRAIRETMAEKDFDTCGQFKGARSRLFVDKIRTALAGIREAETEANALSLCAGHYLAKLDPKQAGKVKTLMFFSPLEYQTFAELLHALREADKEKLVAAVAKIDMAKLAEDEDEDDGEDGSAATPDDAPKTDKDEKKLTPAQFGKIVAAVLKKPIEKAFRNSCLPKDAADIALFGRMVASDHSLTVEGAAMFSHALSTHKADNEIDFFSAVDDLQPKEESGAGMTGTLEFNSATYYRFAAVNLDMLFDQDHLGAMTPKERNAVVFAFVEATIKAIPAARKNTMNGNTMPQFVLGVVRQKGHPVQLVNAFESPLRSNGGYAAESIARLKAEYEKLKTTWDLEAVFEKNIPQLGLRAFLDEVVQHVA